MSEISWSYNRALVCPTLTRWENGFALAHNLLLPQFLQLPPPSYLRVAANSINPRVKLTTVRRDQPIVSIRTFCSTSCHSLCLPKAKGKVSAKQGSVIEANIVPWAVSVRFNRLASVGDPRGLHLACTLRIPPAIPS